MTIEGETPLVRRRTGRRALAQHLRVLRVIAGAEFKAKYAGSILGYAWSVLRPLALFSLLYAVFGRVLRLGTASHYYPLSLLIGIVLFNFFTDATMHGMHSIVLRESWLRKLSFPRLLIPTSATLTVAITFAVNLTVVIAFIAWNAIVPRPSWLLIVPLLAELYVFSLGVSLILATLHVRFRDIGQLWELALQLIFYATPIIYPISFLPEWARRAVLLNPFTQILQDVRSLILYGDVPGVRLTASQVFGGGGDALPIAIAVVLFALGIAVFRHDEPWFAERV